MNHLGQSYRILIFISFVNISRNGECCGSGSGEVDDTE
jgi:hypothetical protein